MNNATSTIVTINTSKGGKYIRKSTPIAKVLHLDPQERERIRNDLEKEIAFYASLRDAGKPILDVEAFSIAPSRTKPKEEVITTTPLESTLDVEALSIAPSKDEPKEKVTTATPSKKMKAIVKSVNYHLKTLGFEMFLDAFIDYLKNEEIDSDFDHQYALDTIDDNEWLTFDIDNFISKPRNETMGFIQHGEHLTPFTFERKILFLFGPIDSAINLKIFNAFLDFDKPLIEAITIVDPYNIMNECMPKIPSTNALILYRACIEGCETSLTSMIDELLDPLYSLEPINEEDEREYDSEELENQEEDTPPTPVSTSTTSVTSDDIPLPPYVPKYESMDEALPFVKPAEKIESGYERTSAVVETIVDYTTSFFPELKLEHFIAMGMFSSALVAAILALTLKKGKKIFFSIMTAMVLGIVGVFVLTEPLFKNLKINKKKITDSIESISFEKEPLPRWDADTEPWTAQASDSALSTRRKRNLRNKNFKRPGSEQIYTQGKMSLVFEAIEKVVVPLTATLITVLGLTNKKTDKIVKKIFATIKQFKHAKSTAAEMKESILEFFFPEKSYGNVLIAQREENLRCIQPPIATLLSSADHYQRLLQCAIHSRKLSKNILDNSGTNEVYKHFMHSYSLVDSKIAECSKILELGAVKQTPTAVWVHGLRAIGKTTLITTKICKDLAKRLQVQPTVFDIKPDNNGYYKEYAGQFFSFMDEVASKKDCVAEFAGLNQIISSAASNIPSAFVKEQPFMSKFLFCISNYALETIDSKCGLLAESSEALRSRFIEIKFINKKVDLSKPRGHDPKWFDITNYQFELTTAMPSSSSKTTKVTRFISYAEMLDIMIDNYNKHREAFEKSCSGMIVKTENAMDRKTPTINFYGPQDTGKTTQAKQFINFYSKAHKKEFRIVNHVDELENVAVGEHLFLNDILNEETRNNPYLFHLENVGPSGMVINTSNITIEKVSWFSIFTTVAFKIYFFEVFGNISQLMSPNLPWYEKLFKAFTGFFIFLIRKPNVYHQLFKEEGFYRRLGYTGVFLHDGKILDVSSSSILCIEAQPLWFYRIGGQKFGADGLLPQICAFLDHSRISGHLIEDFDFEAELKTDWQVCIDFDAPDVCFQYFRTFSPLSISPNLSRNSVTFRDSAIFRQSTVDISIFRDFISNLHNIEEQAVAVLTYIAGRVPKIKVLVRIGNKLLRLENSVITKNFENLPLNLIGKFENDKYYISLDGEDYEEDKFLQYVTTATDYGITNTELLVFEKMAKASVWPQHTQEVYDKIMMDQLNTRQLTAFELFLADVKVRCTNTLIFKFMFGLFGVIALVMLGIKIFKGDKEEIEEQAMKRQRLALRRKIDGKRYYLHQGGAIYSDDGAFREARYEDHLERDEMYDEEDYYNQSMRVVMLEPDYYDRVVKTKENNKHFGVVLPRGGQFMMQDVKIWKKGSRENFSMKCLLAFECGSIEEINAFDQNFPHLSMTYNELCKALIENKGATIIYATHKRPLPRMALPSAVLKKIFNREVTSFSTTIQGKVNEANIVELETNKTYSISVIETTDPNVDVNRMAPSKYRKRYFKVSNFSLPAEEQETSTQQIDSLMRVDKPFDYLLAKIRRNAVQVISPRGAVGGIHVHDGWVLTVRHCIRGFGVDEITLLEASKKVISYKVIEHPLRDLALIKTDFIGKSLLKHLMDSPLPLNQVALAALGTESTIHTNARTVISDIVTDQREIISPKSCFRGTFAAKSPTTQNGDCGRPYVAVTEIPSIFGIHIAGSEQACYGVLIDKTWIADNTRPPSTQALSRYDVPEFTGFLSIEERIPMIKSPNKPYSVPSPLKDYLYKVVPSLKCPVKTSIEQCTEEEKSNIAFNAFGEHDFYLSQILQYNDEVKPFHSKVSEAFVAGFIAQHGPSLLNHQVGNILSEKEALHGLCNPNDPLCRHANSLNWQSSIGYEMRNQFSVQTMEDIYDPMKEEYLETTAAMYFRERVHKAFLKSFSGKRFREILQDNLKQENRENAKAYKQRVFTSFPKSLSLLVRTFTLRFAGWINKHHETLPYKISMNTAAEFDTIRREAEIFDGNLMGFGFDVSRCDKHIRQQFFDEVLKQILRKIVTLEHANSTCNCNHTLEQHLCAIDVVILHLYDNFVASQDCIYHKTTGSSSGSDLTIIINVLYLDWMLFAWFCKVATMCKRFPPTYAAYTLIIYKLLCGDDGKLVIKSGFHDVFTFSSFKSFLADRGINIDSPEKDGVDFDLKHFDDIPFVSRRWIKHIDDSYYHQFKIEIISGLIYWTVENDPIQIDLHLELLSEYIAPHGEQMYNEFVAGVINYQRDYPSQFVVPSFSEALFKTLRHIRGMAFVQNKIKSENPILFSIPKTQMNMQMENSVNVFPDMSEATPRKSRDVDIVRLDRKYNRFIKNLTRNLKRAAANVEMGEWMQEQPVTCFHQLFSFLAFCRNMKRDQTYNDLKAVPLPTKEKFFSLHEPLQYNIFYLLYEAMEKFNFPQEYIPLCNTYMLTNVLNFKKELKCYESQAIIEKLRSHAEENVTTQMMRQERKATPSTSATGMFIDPAPDQQQMGYQGFVQGNSNPIPEQSSLATLDTPTMPTMENMFISSTIPYGNPMQTRLDYLPDSLLAAGGVTENLMDLAYGSYQVVEIINVPVNTQQDRLVYTVKYGLDLLGGMARVWAQQHRRFTGPIAVKLTFVSTSVIQGEMRAYWTLPGRPRNIANSSLYGARDIDLSAPRQEINMILQPVSGPDGKFFFQTDQPNDDQSEINIITLTDIGNSFSDLGNIQIIVESRILPTMRFADPYGPEETRLEQDLPSILELEEIDLNDSSLYIETKRYPKFPDLPADITHYAIPLDAPVDSSTKELIETPFINAGFVQGDLFYSVENPTPVIADVNHGKISTQSYECILASASNSYFTTVNAVTSYGQIARSVENRRALTDIKIYNMESYETQVDADIKTFETVVNIGGRLVASTDYKIEFNYDVNVARKHPTAPLLIKPLPLPAAEVQNVSVVNTLDNLVLPTNYYTLEIGSIDRSNPIKATAPMLNSAVRSEAGWAIHNYCRQICPVNGQVKISIIDPTFGTTLTEFLYRRNIGFFTTATPDQINTVFNGTLAGFKIIPTVYRDQSTIQLNNDFSAFISRTPEEISKNRVHTQAAMAGALGGLFGGLGQGLTTMGQWKHENEMQAAAIANSKYGIDMNNANALQLKQMTGDQQLQQMNLRFDQQNMTDNIRYTPKNVKGAMFQPPKAPQNIRGVNYGITSRDVDPIFHPIMANSTLPDDPPSYSSLSRQEIPTHNNAVRALAPNNHAKNEPSQYRMKTRSATPSTSSPPNVHDTNPAEGIEMSVFKNTPNQSLVKESVC